MSMGMKEMTKVLIIALLIGGAVGVKVWTDSHKKPTTTMPTQNELPRESDGVDVVVVAENLDTPWGMVFLPAGDMLLTERLGRVRYINPDGVLQSEPVATIQKSKEIGEGGLLGIALHPQFAQNKSVYLYYTYDGQNDNTLNRVVRMNYLNGKLDNEQTILDAIPGAANHNGGRIAFGPDGYLYVTTGDAQEPSLAQDTNSLAGKMLRLTDEGKPAPGNPFKNEIYSYGHRNSQGLAWDDKGRLWSTEHGRSGALSGLDELNLIESGKNYGWPTIQGDEEKEGMESPKVNSGSLSTWAPAGTTFINGSIFFSGLRGETLYEALISANPIQVKEHYKGEYGRIRDVQLGPDNYLYIATSNQDGRGRPRLSDDRIIKLKLSL